MVTNVAFISVPLYPIPKTACALIIALLSCVRTYSRKIKRIKETRCLPPTVTTCAARRLLLSNAANAKPMSAKYSTSVAILSTCGSSANRRLETVERSRTISRGVGIKLQIGNALRRLLSSMAGRLKRNWRSYGATR